MSQLRSRLRAVLHRLTPDFLHPRCPQCGSFQLYCQSCRQLTCVHCNHLAHIFHKVDVYALLLDSPWSVTAVWRELLSLWQAFPFDSMQRSIMLAFIVLSYGFLALITWGQWIAMAIMFLAWTVALPLLAKLYFFLLPYWQKEE